MPSAGKTGTTSDKKDGWFCGYTPYYTTAVWVGYDSPKTLDDLYGSTYPLTIWRTFMEDIHQNLERVEFPSYESSSGDYSNNDTSVATEEPAEEPTIDPDAADETEKPSATPEATQKPKATKAPVVTAAPTQEPEEEMTPDEEPEDVPDDVSDDDGNDGEDVPDDAAEEEDE
jgi:membrane peptidoglycan carboxypeptidase